MAHPGWRDERVGEHHRRRHAHTRSAGRARQVTRWDSAGCGRAGLVGRRAYGCRRSNPAGMHLLLTATLCILSTMRRVRVACTSQVEHELERILRISTHLESARSASPSRTLSTRSCAPRALAEPLHPALLFSQAPSGRSSWRTVWLRWARAVLLRLMPATPRSRSAPSTSSWRRCRSVCGDLRGQQRGRVRIIGSRLSPLFAQVNSAETIDALSQVRNQSVGPILSLPPFDL